MKKYEQIDLTHIIKQNNIHTFKALNAIKEVEKSISILKEYDIEITVTSFNKRKNWFEKLPLHYKLIYYYVGGIITAFLFHYLLLINQ